MDPRSDIARFYDAGFQPVPDVDFYRSFLSIDGSTRLLELGCGTGRVMASLLPECAAVVGVDQSESMLAHARDRLAGAGHDERRAELVRGDICRVDLARRFDLIVAPFRVFQNLETDEQVDALFTVIRRHLADGGTCILNAFNPNTSREELVSIWRRADPDQEHGASEHAYRNGVLRHSFRQLRMSEDPLVIYAELIFRYYENGALVDEARFVPPMRVWYPEELAGVVEDHGFEITDRWGGYAGEEYERGPELVVRFRA